MADDTVSNDSKMEDAIRFEPITQEQLVKELTVLASAEQERVSREILAKADDEVLKKTLSNPSGIALTTALPSTGSELSRVKKSVRDLFALYLTNQFVARAIQIRADTLISKGYNIIGEDIKGVDACKELTEKSGGVNLFNQLSVNTDVSGNGFLEKIYNVKKNKILRLKHVHPLTMDFKKDQYGNIVVDANTKEPVGFTQIYRSSEGVEKYQDIPKEVIEHLKFNTLGDEFTGVSTIQPGYDTIVRLMNMEYSAAEAAVKIANPIIIAECNTKSPQQVALWGQTLGRINGRDQLMIPEGMKITLLSPGAQNFTDYAPYFLNAVIACFGTPRSLLLGEGGSNRSEGIILSRHFYSVIRGNQYYMEAFFNRIFEEYAKLAGFAAPKLTFDDIAEDVSLASQAAMQLYQSGIISQQEARAMIGLDAAVEGDVISPVGASADIKQADRATQFPASPGKATGSQSGIKAKRKTNPLTNIGAKLNE